MHAGISSTKCILHGWPRQERRLTGRLGQSAIHGRAQRCVLRRERTAADEVARAMRHRILHDAFPQRGKRIEAAVLAMELTGEVAQWDCVGRS